MSTRSTGYKVKARDSASPANVGTDSAIGYAYTLISTPTGCTASKPTATTIDLTATGSLPNITQGLSGTLFATTGGEWTGSWRTGYITDTAVGLTPNTSYTFHVKARNGDGIATGWSSGTATFRTLAAQPLAMGYNPVTCQGVQANWGANGNPAGTQYFCIETETGKSSGWITDTYWALTGLEPNHMYHFKVKARNADKVETDYTDLGAVQTQMSIGQAKMLRVGDLVVLDNKVVTAFFKAQNLMFVEDAFAFGRREGVAGIGVVPSGAATQFPEGTTVRIIGQTGVQRRALRPGAHHQGAGRQADSPAWGVLALRRQQQVAGRRAVRQPAGRVSTTRPRSRRGRPTG